MKNPATHRSQDKLNTFTEEVMELDALGWGPHKVLLRNGDLVKPEYIAAEDDNCEDCFGVDQYRWNLDGTSVTRRDYDMMEII